jgi:hypothetical protein
MITTKRVFWAQQSSGWHNYNWNAISAHSVVHISVSEGEVFRDVIDPRQAIFHRRGEAAICVKNINPHSANGGGVEFYLEVGWRSPLDVVIDITVLDPPNFVEQA